MHIKLPSLHDFSRDAKLLIAATGMFAVSFFGIISLLRVLYVLRLGYGPEYIGIFNAMGALTYMAMGLPSGALGTRFGTRKTMLVGGLITVIGMCGLPMTEGVPAWMRDFWPFFSQIVLTIGWSMFNVNMVPALMATTNAWNRNTAYALSSALRETGTLVGTLVGGVLPGMFAAMLGETLDVPIPYRFALWVGAGVGLIAIIPLALIKKVKAPQTKARIEPRGAAPLLPILMMAAYVYVRHAGWATCHAFCNAYMDTDLNLSTSSIGLISGVAQFAAIIASLLTPRLMKRFGNGGALMISTLGISASLLPIGLIPNWTATAAGRIGIQIMVAIWLPVVQVFQMELVDEKWRSLAYGAMSTAMGFGFGTASLAGGYLIAAQGYRTLFLIGAGLDVIAAAVLWWILKQRARTAPALSSSA